MNISSAKTDGGSWAVVLLLPAQSNQISGLFNWYQVVSTGIR